MKERERRRARSESRRRARRRRLTHRLARELASVLAAPCAGLPLGVYTHVEEGQLIALAAPAVGRRKAVPLVAVTEGRSIDTLREGERGQK